MQLLMALLRERIKGSCYAAVFSVYVSAAALAPAFYGANPLLDYVTSSGCY